MHTKICHAKMGWAEGSAFAGSGNRQGTIPSKKKEHFEPPLVEACGGKGTMNDFLNWRVGGGGEDKTKGSCCRKMNLQKSSSRTLNSGTL